MRQFSLGARQVLRKERSMNEALEARISALEAQAASQHELVHKIGNALIALQQSHEQLQQVVLNLAMRNPNG